MRRKRKASGIVEKYGEKEKIIDDLVKEIDEKDEMCRADRNMESDRRSVWWPLARIKVRWHCGRLIQALWIRVERRILPAARPLQRRNEAIRRSLPNTMMSLFLDLCCRQQRDVRARTCADCIGGGAALLGPRKGLKRGVKFWLDESFHQI